MLGKKLKPIFRITGALIFLCSFLIGLWGFYILNNMSRGHAKMDSEGGTFVYGMMSFMYLGGMFIGILTGTTIWGIGIAGRIHSNKMQKIEGVVQRVFFYLSIIPFLALIGRLAYVVRIR